jgi:NhaP-type Na+/H+ or K+/H+ antiporter
LSARVKWALAIVALALLVVASFSRRLQGTPVTPAMVFTVIGLIAGPLALAELELPPTGSTVRALAEATLAIVLFSDASRIRLRELRRELGVPTRLLGIGLPLTIGLGAVVGAALFSSLDVAELLLLGVVLAPTDAALGQAVVVDRRLPSRIRQGLNVESGLNDGICVPLLLIFLAAAEAETGTTSHHHAIQVVAEQIGYGIVGGLVAGAGSATLVARARRHDLIAGPWLQVVPVATAALAYGLASGLGGSGFIAAFVAGALFGAMRGKEAATTANLSEELADLLGGVTFLVFGAVLFGPTLENLSVSIVAYAVLSLTVVRMLPVAVALVGSRARPQTLAFLGWFGPRGLASIVFTVTVVEESRLPGARTLELAAYATIGLSVIAHGLSAAPLAARYARWYAAHPAERRPEMESRPAPMPRARRVLAHSIDVDGGSNAEQALAAGTNGSA